MSSHFINRVFVVCLLCSLLASCSFKEKGFYVSGEIAHLPAGTKLYLEELNYDNVITLDTTKTDSKGQFALKGFLKHEGLYQIRFGKSNFIMLVMDEKPQSIEIKADTGSFLLQPYSIKGSPLSSQLQDFLVNISNRYSELRKIYVSMSDTARPLTDSVKMVYEAELQRQSLDARDFITHYVDTVSDPVIGIFATYNFLNPKMDMPVFEKVAARVQKKYPDLPLGKAFIDDLVQVQRQLNPAANQPLFSNGSTLPDIELNDLNDKPIKLSSLRGKYVLVDFWASWCGPCRAENPNLVRAYNEFKDKGFTVYSVSLDDDRDKWLKAIKKDSLSWPNHVTDLMAWRSPVAIQFGINSIPASYLLDKDGKVIAADLRGSELENILKQALK